MLYYQPLKTQRILYHFQYVFFFAIFAGRAFHMEVVCSHETLFQYFANSYKRNKDQLDHGQYLLTKLLKVKTTYFGVTFV